VHGWSAPFTRWDAHAATPSREGREALDLVERRANESDGRLVEVHLRPTGEALLQRLASLHRAELASLAGVFRVPQIDLPSR